MSTEPELDPSLVPLLLKAATCPSTGRMSFYTLEDYHERRQRREVVTSFPDAYRKADFANEVRAKALYLRRAVTEATVEMLELLTDPKVVDFSRLRQAQDGEPRKPRIFLWAHITSKSTFRLRWEPVARGKVHEIDHRRKYGGPLGDFLDWPGTMTPSFEEPRDQVFSLREDDHSIFGGYQVDPDWIVTLRKEYGAVLQDALATLVKTLQCAAGVYLLSWPTVADDGRLDIEHGEERAVRLAAGEVADAQREIKRLEELVAPRLEGAGVETVEELLQCRAGAQATGMTLSKYLRHQFVCSSPASRLNTLSGQVDKLAQAMALRKEAESRVEAITRLMKDNFEGLAGALVKHLIPSPA